MTDAFKTPVLIVQPHWANLILSGEKTAEIRGQTTRHRGRVGLSVSGASGAETVIGSVDLLDCEGPITLERYRELAPLHLVDRPITGRKRKHENALPYARTFVYHLRAARSLDAPIACPRKHCVTWATLHGQLPDAAESAPTGTDAEL